MHRRFALILVLFLWVGEIGAQDDDLDRLLEGVETFVAPGCVPSELTVFGPDAFVVATGSVNGHAAPLVAAARHGRGRVVAVGHGGLMCEANRSFLLGSVRWLSGAAEKRIRIGVVGHARVVSVLGGGGAIVVRVDAREIPQALEGIDLLVVSSHRFSGAENKGSTEAVMAWVGRGGGLLTDGVAWGWLQLNPGRDLRLEFGGNRLLARTGIAWTDGTLGGNGSWPLRRNGLRAASARTSLEALASHESGEVRLEEAVRIGAVRAVMAALRSLPEEGERYVRTVERLCRRHAGTAVPTSEAPLRASDPFARLSVALDSIRLARLPVPEIEAHRSAEAFPGPVGRGARRVERRLLIETSIPGRHSTGLYAAPGAPIEIRVPENAAGRGLGLRIGAHSDRLWHKEEWKRFPEISRWFGLDAPQTPVASPFGGLIYLEVPDGCRLGAIEVRIGGGVLAPLYVHGRTPVETWRREVRRYPAPWAELATGKVVLTVPSGVVRELEDPAALMEVWDRVLDAAADLAGIDPDRLRPERYVADVQISAGYMHSGYPIMTHLDAAERMVDAELLTRRGDWGLFHELGHNHQSRAWTFGGTGEVTCNLFSLYLAETVSGVDAGSHPWLYTEGNEIRYRRYFAEGATFDTWKSDPALALRFYSQLQQAFGWKVVREVIASYRSTPAAELPADDAARRDEWMVRYSHAVERNLGPFFEAWGIPVSREARDRIAALPGWMPGSFPPESDD